MAGGLFLSLYDKAPNSLFLSNLNLHVVLMASAIFIIFKEKDYYRKKTISLLEYVRKDLFGIYLTHALWLAVFSKIGIMNVLSHIITIPVLTIITFVLSLYTTKIIRRIPVLSKIIS